MFKLFVLLTIHVILLEALESNGGIEKYPTDVGIAGGHDVDIKDYPYVLSLVWRNFTHVCGAVLIGEKWVITAYLCGVFYRTEDLSVRVNTSIVSVGELVQVARTVIYPNMTNTQDPDLVLLELSTNVSCVNCKPIPLGTKAPAVGANVTLLGWGNTDPDINYGYSDHSEILQAVDVPVIDYEVCKTAYELLHTNISENVFCAGANKAGACAGDYGGPAVIDGALVGLFSGNYYCGRQQFPGLFTLLPKYVEWIRETTGITL